LFGIILVSAGLFLNQWTLAAIFSPEDMRIVHLPSKILIGFFDVILVLAGTAAIRYRKSLCWKNVLLAVFSLTLSFFCLIIADTVRTYYLISNGFDKKAPLIHELDRNLGWRPKANLRTEYKGKAIIIDSQGRREIVNQEGKGRYNIYFFGDSFTFGEEASNENTFSNIIAEKYLADDIHVYNMGVVGYGIVQMYQRFLQIENQLQPGDKVIFTPISHDFERDYQSFDFVCSLLFTPGDHIEYFPVFEDHKITSVKLDTVGNRLRCLFVHSPIFSIAYDKFFVLESHDSRSDANELLEIMKRKSLQKKADFILILLPGDAIQLKPGKELESPFSFQYFRLTELLPHDSAKQLRMFTADEAGGHYSEEGNKWVARAILKTLLQEEFLDEKDFKEVP